MSDQQSTPATEKPELVQIYEDEHLRITGIRPKAPGGDLVVAFSGIGPEAGGNDGFLKIPPEEFVGISSAHDRGALFVADLRATWYTVPGLAEKVEEVVNATVKEWGATRVVTLGNSMGGFGALHFARRLNASVALAFAPQFSMKPDRVREGRWKQYRVFQDMDAHSEIGDDISPDCRYLVIFGGRCKLDRPHYNEMVQVEGVECLLVRGAKHNVARVLKTRGLLADIVDAAIADQPLPEGLDEHLMPASEPPEE